MSERPAPRQLTMTSPRRGKPPRHLADLDMPGRVAAAEQLGLPGFRAKQLSNHYFARLAGDPAAMTDLPAGQRADIVAAFLPPLLTEVRSQQADAGQTVKTLWRTHDGALVESVLMRYPGRATVCISSQAGCGMNARTIRDQVAHGDPDAQARRLTNVVFMGMGEALANYRSAVAALHRLVDRPPHGMGLPARAVTVSTVGLVPAIDRLAAEPGPGVRLALSLHAPDDELRDELVPVNARWGVAEALDAAYRYYRAVGQRVSIEYALIRDTNDQAWRADLLGKLLNRRGTNGA